MAIRDKKIWIRCICALMAAFLFASAIMLMQTNGNTRYFEGEAEEYYQSLMDVGFPRDYAIALTELHLLHPTWHFKPLHVTDGNSDYTWDYVIEKETESPDNNLISSDASQKPYRHLFNKEQYDAGHYQASTAAVEYFMDPRNFLNETDIFQFYDLSATEGSSLEAVEAVLAGGFMDGTTLENGKTYAEYFLLLGEELGVDPVYLAVKVRNEQGLKGTSPLISGDCGTLLEHYYRDHVQYSEAGNTVLAPSSGYTSDELLGMNDLYNHFNINASGNGLFAIYSNAMKRAQKGTEVMRDQWGGSPSWDTRWKSLYGGAYFIKASYVDRYQNTIYLQKFNVDSRSGRNFWGQYTQSVGAALTEGRMLYTSFAAIGALDSACTFQIPVYDDMPRKACKDPANGDCSYLAVATDKYEYNLSVMAPYQINLKNTALYRSCNVLQGYDLRIDATVKHSYGVVRLEYQWDGSGEWHSLPLSASGGVTADIPMTFSEGSSHILVIRGCAAYDNSVSTKKSNYHFLCAVIYVDVTAPPR